MVLMFTAVIPTIKDSLIPQQAASCVCEECSWCKWIMGNTTISGLIHNGEAQTIEFLSKGAWDNQINDICFYLVWRIGSAGRDLQAHIELAKMGEKVYRMEIYHSWNTLQVIIGGPYSYTVLPESNDFMLVLSITEP